MFPTPDREVPDVNDFETMNQELTKLMPQEMANAVNLFAHPVAGAAAMSALGVGLASHAFGLWVGALTGAAEVSQRLLQPVLDDFPGSVESFAGEGADTAAKAPAARARATTKKLIAEAQSVAEKIAEPIAEPIQEAPPAEIAVAEVPAPVAPTVAVMPEDFRKPAAVDKPATPDDLKAITGIGRSGRQVAGSGRRGSLASGLPARSPTTRAIAAKRSAATQPSQLLIRPPPERPVA